MCADCLTFKKNSTVKTYFADLENNVFMTINT